MKPVAVYHAQPYSNRDPLRRLVMPDFYVDVTDREEDKVAMLAKHVSQKRWLDESQGLDSYLQTLRDQDAAVGRMSQAFSICGGMAAPFACGILCRAIRSLVRGSGRPHRRGISVSESLTDLIAQFRESLGDCKRLYIQAARVALQDQPSASEETRGAT